MRNRKRRPRGFTLIEIMVVIAIIALLMTLVAPNVMNRLREAKVTTAQAQMKNILEPAVNDFRRHHNRLPESLEELLQPAAKNFDEPYLNEDNILDPWGNPYKFNKISGSKFDIISLGADGLEGGETDDADLSLKKKSAVGG